MFKLVTPVGESANRLPFYLNMDTVQEIEEVDRPERFTPETKNEKGLVMRPARTDPAQKYTRIKIDGYTSQLQVAESAEVLLS